ncbi:MAG: hypothetical protein CL779_00690 [Chloroflexi bacterium]|nr:hypothetical protein [Chloroflexota bacterium]|tara:strand:+ start:452 stop:838 length:387 start_codon:yes stop_codon:yes gene_type:complete
MARKTEISGVGTVSSQTWYPMPPIEWGRAGAAVATIAIGTGSTNDGGGGGTDGTVSNQETTTDGNGTGLKVDLTISGNVCTAIAPATGGGQRDGVGYRIGDKITITAANAGTNNNVVGYVTSLEYEKV